MANPTFDRAKELFDSFSDYCSAEGIFVVIDGTGVVRLYDLDSVHTIAEQEFSDHDDPIIALIETMDGVDALESNLGYVEAGIVDMVF